MDAGRLDANKFPSLSFRLQPSSLFTRSSRVYFRSRLLSYLPSYSFEPVIESSFTCGGRSAKLGHTNQRLPSRVLIRQLIWPATVSADLV